MDTAVKQRLIGAAVLAALAMIFLPMLLQSPDMEDSEAGEVSLTLPAAPGQKFETRELALPVPGAPGTDVPAGGVLGAPADAEPDPNAVVTVEASEPAPRDVFPVPPADSKPAVPVDAATGAPLTPAPAPVAAPTPAVPTEALAPEAPSAPVLSAPTVAAGGYVVSIGSYSSLDNARALQAKLSAAGLPVIAESIELSGKPALRLRVGPYAERAAAEAARLRAQTMAALAGTVIALDASAPRSPATPPAPMAAKVGFAVQLGALRVEADAIALRDRARAAGFVAFHQRMQTEDGVLFRVRVGPEADRVAAERLRDAVAAKLGVTGLVVSHP